MADDEKDPKSPATTSAAYDEMRPVWAKIDTLLAGTDAMRAAGEDYLPQHAEEEDDAYNERLSRTTLLNMLQMTLDGWVGRPFNKPVEMKDDVPAEIKALTDDIDLQGNNLSVFARHWFRDGLAKGFSHVLVDFPRPAPKPDGQPRTKADDLAENLRPYLCHIPAENLIFAYAEVIGGVETLLHVRIRECVTKIVGFAEVQTEQIRVIEPGKVSIYEERRVKGKKVQWVPVSNYNYDLGYIPLVTFYADKQGLMLSKPPLSDLADLNIRHWQSTSDQISVLTVARFPMLACSGAISDDKLRVGPRQWLNTSDPTGKFYYVEHTGAAIAAGRRDILDLEEMMAGYGATFLTRSSQGGGGATGRALDSAETTSPLQDMSIRFQDALGQAMQVVADWMKLPTGGTYSVTTEFSVNDDGGASLAALQAARANRDLSRARYMAELKRFGVVDHDYDYEADAKLLAAEPPPVAAPSPVNIKTVVNGRNGGKKKKIDPAIKPPAN